MKSGNTEKGILTSVTELIARLRVVAGHSRLALSRLEQYVGAGIRDEAIQGIATITKLTTQTLRSHPCTVAAGCASNNAQRDLHIATEKAQPAAATNQRSSAQTRVAAETGAIDMEQMKGAMDAIKLSSDEIAKIVKTVDEIAFLTTILALNAAGEADLSCAVVAEEVRALAQRSAQAASELRALVGAVNRRTTTRVAGAVHAATPPAQKLSVTRAPANPSGPAPLQGQLAAVVPAGTAAIFTGGRDKFLRNN